MGLWEVPGSSPNADKQKKKKLPIKKNFSQDLSHSLYDKLWIAHQHCVLCILFFLYGDHVSTKIGLFGFICHMASPVFNSYWFS